MICDRKVASKSESEDLQDGIETRLDRNMPAAQVEQFGGKVREARLRLFKHVKRRDILDKGC